MKRLAIFVLPAAIAAFFVGAILAIPSGAARDRTPPSTPTNLHVTGQTETSISVAWNASTDNVGVVGYNKFRDGTKVSDTDTDLTYTFSLGTWVCEETHTLGVRAYDAAGNMSGTAQITAQTAACPDLPPSTPSNLHQTGATADSITVAWDASTDDHGVVGYYKWRDGVAGTDVDNDLTWTANPASPQWQCGESHVIEVAAYDAVNNISAHASITGQTSSCPTNITDIGAYEQGSSAVYGAQSVFPAIPDFPHGTGTTRWVSGTGSGTACTQASPCSLATGEGQAQPGDTLMFTPGTHRICSFRPKVSGSASAYLTWSAPALGDVVIAPTAGCNSTLFQMISSFEATDWSNGVHYLAFTNLIFDGREPDGSQTTNMAVKMRKYTHHFLFANNIVRYTGSTGVSCRSCDYVRYLYNSLYRTGHVDGSGWGSALNLHYTDGLVHLDSYAGFHDIIARNLISGTYDPYGNGTRTPGQPHTDGNCTISDNASATNQDDPNTLVARNVCWQAGGKGLHVLGGNNHWFVNNTSVFSGLDPEMGSPAVQGAVNVRNVSNGYVLNNLTVARSDRACINYGGTVSGVVMRGNLCQDGMLPGVPSADATDPTHVLLANAGLIGPLPSSADGAQLTAVAPWDIGSALIPMSTSPAVDAGIDPRAFMNTEQAADLDLYGL